MQFEVIGVDPNGDEQTLVTDVQDMAEARARAEAYGWTVRSVRPAGADAEAALAVAADADPPSVAASPSAGGSGGTGRAIGSIIMTVLAVALVSLRLVRTCDRPKNDPVQIDPATLRDIQDRMRPKLPDWAEDAQRRSDEALAEINRARAAQPSTRPGGNEEWVKENGVWRRVR